MRRKRKKYNFRQRRKESNFRRKKEDRNVVAIMRLSKYLNYCLIILNFDELIKALGLGSL